MNDVQPFPDTQSSQCGGAETGQLNVIVSGSKTPIYGLARSLGASDEEMIDAWGEQLFLVNKKKFSESQIAKLYDKLARGRKDAKTDGEKMAGLRESLQRIRLDPEVMEATLGKPYERLDKDVLLQSTKKLIAISRGEADSDDRDNMAFQEIYGPEDIFEERIAKDSGSFRRMLLNNLTFRYGGNIEKIPAGALSKQVDGAILASGLAGNPEEINRLEIFDKAYSLTKLGQGGVPSIQSVPDESRNVHPSQRGYIDPSRTPESTRVGVDTYLATASRKGADRQLYAPVLDRNGEEKMLRPKDFLRSTVAIASEYHRAADDDYIPVMQKGRENLARKEDVDYVIPHFEEAFSPLANLIPFKSAAQGNRVAMGSRMLTQALPLNKGEAPLVQAGVPGKPDRSYYQEFGRDVGAVFAEQPGIVLEATDRHILIQNADGTKKTIHLDHYQASNRKTYSHQEPVVAIGQHIASGDLLVKSNMTDEQGQVALGLNAKVVMIPWKGLNFEDGMLVSESFAKRLTSQHMYQNRLDWTPDYRRGKHAFMGIFPSTFDKTQLEPLDDEGVIRPGSTVRSGDPLILAARLRDGGGKTGKRKLYGNASVIWEHQDDGIVTDVLHSDKGTAVLVRSESPLREADKISNRFGNKGVVRILPDDEMPMTEDGMVAEVAFSPGSTAGRGNPVQLAELALGKIAMKTGKPYRVPDFEDIDDIPAFVDAELKKHEIEPESAVIDRRTGKKLYNGDGSGIANGSMWIMKLHHTSESKGSARGLGSYGADETPSKGGDSGAKRNLRALILSLLTPQEIWNLRKRYALGKETIMEMAKRSHCPPVLLYCVLTPLWSKTALKLKLLRAEIKVEELRTQGRSIRAEILQLPESDIAEHADRRYASETYLVRPWYHDRAPRPVDPNEILYDEETLPPTSRLDWQNNQLSEIDEKRKGRCPECGRMMYLPCLPCRIQRDLIRGVIPKAAEFDPADEEDEVEPELMFL